MRSKSVFWLFSVGRLEFKDLRAERAWGVVGFLVAPFVRGGLTVGFLFVVLLVDALIVSRKTFFFFCFFWRALLRVDLLSVSEHADVLVFMGSR